MMCSYLCIKDLCPPAVLLVKEQQLVLVAVGFQNNLIGHSFGDQIICRAGGTDCSSAEETLPQLLLLAEESAAAEARAEVGVTSRHTAAD